MGVKVSYKSQPDVILELTPQGKVKGFFKKARPKKVSAKQLKPKAPEISLAQPGHLRVANLMSLFGVSRTTLYAGVNAGRYPKPDGKDGRLPYWNTETIRAWLAGKQG